MTLGSLFDGISGFPLAASWCGIETKWISEKEAYPLKVSKRHFPNSIQYGDIKELGKGRKFELEPVDIICGGDPCQPSSLLGKRGGKEDPRYLWPEKFRIIKELRPGWVINENVTGTISNGILDQKISDLESEDYTCWPAIVIPASAVGAYHQRYRVWLVAYTNSIRRDECWQEAGNEKKGTKQIKLTGCRKGSFWESSKICTADFCGMAHGVPGWMDRNTAGGNSIVPQIAYEFFKAIQESNLIFDLPNNK